MLAPDGRCKALDAAADGYVRSEAAAAVVLRALNSLTTPGQGAGSSRGSILLLLGTSVNQDGRSSSLTAPNGPAQSALVRAALAAASLPAARLNLLSMHGTGGWQAATHSAAAAVDDLLGVGLLAGRCWINVGWHLPVTITTPFFR
jgi:acyl transferase domain-containing protein